MSQNPFAYRGMLKSTKLFWGRKAEISNIYSCLLDSEDEPQSVAVLGQRRIGKSSLLHRIFKKELADELYAEQLENTLTVMISMQNLVTSKSEQFFEQVLDDIKSISVDLENSVTDIKANCENDSEISFNRLLRKLTGQGQLLIILIDEFEAVSQNPSFDLYFFDKLRAQMQERRLAFVISIQTDIEHLWGGALIDSPNSSPFFNVFQHFTLRGFTEEETEQYLHQFCQTEEQNSFSSDEIDLIRRFAGNHPFFINLAAYHLLENKLSGQQLSLYEASLEIENDPSVRSIYKYYVNTLSDTNKKLLTSLASSKLEYPYMKEVETGLHWLFKLSLVDRNRNGIYSPFSDSFSQFLQQLKNIKYGKDFESIETNGILEILSGDESTNLEFKSSLRWDVRESKKNEELEIACLKTIAAFLNAHGGTLIIGVDDQQNVLGLENDYKTFTKKPDKDGFELHLFQIIKNRIGTDYCELISIVFHVVDGQEICQIVVEPSAIPAFVDNDKLYFRIGNSTENAKTAKDAIRWYISHWQNNGNIKRS